MAPPYTKKRDTSDWEKGFNLDDSKWGPGEEEYRKQYEKKLNEALLYTPTASQTSFGAVTPFSPVSAPQASQSVDVAKMRDSLISSMQRNVDRAPQYKYDLEMPTRPKSADIPFERSISNRSTSGAGLQEKISPDDFLQAALRRYAARRG
jgi:hypothetical protein